MIPLIKECPNRSYMTFEVGQVYLRWILNRFYAVTRIIDHIDNHYILESYYGPDDEFEYVILNSTYQNMNFCEYWEAIDDDLWLEITLQGYLPKDYIYDNS